MADPREDERQIRRLVARYCHSIAERDDAAWADTWAEDGEWRVLGNAVRGRDQIAAHYLKLVGSTRWVVQFAHDGIVDVAGDGGEGRWQIHELMQFGDGRSGQNIARYRDRYVRCADGAWRFALRELTATYIGPPDLSAGPLPERLRGPVRS